MEEPRMVPGKNGRERIFLGAVLLVSLVGIVYFGIQAVRENSRRSTDNPFAYDIEEYKSGGGEMIRYSEAPPLLPGLEHMTALAVGGDDRIYVAGDGGVTVFDSAGERTGFLSFSEVPRCLALDVNDDLYAGFTDHIAVYDDKGMRKSLWRSPSEAAIFTSIALADDYVFAADAGTKVVWRFDRTGLNPVRIGDRNPDKDIPGFIIPSPYFDVAVDEDGFLWAANTGRHSLENYSFAGDFRSSWGEFSMDLGGFCGCCNPTHFALLADGSFVTSEKGIPRVKITNRAGFLSAVVAGPDQFAEGTVGLDLAVDSRGRILVLDPIRKAVRIFVDKEREGRQP